MICTPVLSVLPVLASILTLSQCFLLNAFAVENRTNTDGLTQEQQEISEQSHNSIEENTVASIIENKMKEVERPPHLPFFVVLQQSGGKKDKKKVLSSNISKRQGGVLQGITNVVSNTRFVTNPFNMASLFGVGILQFLGMQAVWLLLMAVSSLVKRKKRSVEEFDDFSLENVLELFKE